MTILLNILPVFLVIALGLACARRGFLPANFLTPANRVAFYLAIPALIFKVLAGAPLQQVIRPAPPLVAVACNIVVWLLAMALAPLVLPGQKELNPSRGTWIQGVMHCNVGFMGLAVVYYALGETGLRLAGLVAPSLMILHNFCAVITLSRWGAGGASGAGAFLRSVLLNPIIIASLAGLAFALGGLRLPQFLTRTLDMLAGLGLPLALLIIGAHLSQSRLAGAWPRLLWLAGLKLLLLPLSGLLVCRWLEVEPVSTAVVVLILGQPAAALVVVMAGDMGGDSRLASQAVSFTTALSAITLSGWLLYLF